MIQNIDSSTIILVILLLLLVKLFINIPIYISSELGMSKSDGTIYNYLKKDNKNDIAAVEKLFMQYKANPQYRLIYACYGFRFDNLEIQFVENQVHTLSPQFLPIYVNPRNDKIQAYYQHDPIFRSRSEFLKELSVASTSIRL
jgi:hypothetical protein